MSLRAIPSAIGIVEGVVSFDSARINSNATTVVKSSPGILHLITVNKAGSAWTITIYDNTQGSGEIIAQIDGTSIGSFAFNVYFETGLTIVTSGTTPGDITVAYL